jgi:hypothetical protein
MFVKVSRYEAKEENPHHASAQVDIPSIDGSLVDEMRTIDHLIDAAPAYIP